MSGLVGVGSEVGEGSDFCVGVGDGAGVGVGEGVGVGDLGDGLGLGLGDGVGEGDGLVESTLKVTELLASEPSRLLLPAASENFELATEITPSEVLLSVGVKVAV